MLAWSREELELIPEKGFNELEISISKSIVEQLAKVFVNEFRLFSSNVV